jgi:plasmid stability protein
MRNVTITLDEEVARWIRIRAAERETSVSRLVGEMLREMMKKQEGYEAAMRRYLADRPVELDPSGVYPSRDELHER